MSFLDQPEGKLAVALGIGLVIGAERERRKSEKQSGIPAGIRTFAVVGLTGGVVALLGGPVMLAIGALVVGGLAIAGYCLGDRADHGFTTEAALVLTYFLGAFADRDPKAALAAGLTAATLLAFRSRLHSAVQKVLSPEELRDALLFAVAAAVVLPLLPDRAVDPLAVLNPFVLWRLVVVMAGMSGAGYVAQRVIGPRFGLALAGFGSGFVSSTATVAAMGQRAKAEPELVEPAAAGAAAATVGSLVQLAILIAAANPPLLGTLALPLGAGGLVALAYAALQTWRARRAGGGPPHGRAFKLTSALAFAALVTLIAFLSTLARRWLGPAAAVATAAVAGLADAHASSAAVASMGGQLSRAGAMLGVLLAVTANTGTKVALAFGVGPRRYALRVTIGLAATVACAWAVAVAILLWRPPG